MVNMLINVVKGLARSRTGVKQHDHSVSMIIQCQMNVSSVLRGGDESPNTHTDTKRTERQGGDEERRGRGEEGTGLQTCGLFGDDPYFIIPFFYFY